MQQDDGQSNPSLEYDERFTSLDAEWSRYDSLSFDDGEQAPVTPAWAELAERAEALLEESADLRVATWHIRAAIRFKGLAVMESALDAIVAMLEKNGKHTQPVAEEGQPDDSHAMALAWLGSANGRREIIRAPLSADSPHNLHGFMRDGHWVGVQAHDHTELLPVRWQHLHAALSTIEGMVNRSDGTHKLSTAGLRDLFAQIERSITRSPSVVESEVIADIASSAAGVTSVSWPYRVVSPATTREQANEYIDAAIAYFANAEPGHPAPLLLLRAQRTIGMNFQQLIEELMPDASTSLGVISGL